MMMLHMTNTKPTETNCCMPGLLQEQKRSHPHFITSQTISSRIGGIGVPSAD